MGRIVSSKKRDIEARIREHLGEMSLLVEELKAAGLPGNEASRMRQYSTALLQSYESLHAIKSYRTPQGIRTFARVYIMLTPIMFGPYYATVAGVGQEDGIGLPFACVFSLLTTMAMEAIFNIRHLLEDPFDPDCSFDAIDVHAAFVTRC